MASKVARVLKYRIGFKIILNSDSFFVYEDLVILLSKPDKISLKLYDKIK